MDKSTYREVKEGGRWVNEKHDYLSIPLMVKENSIVVLGACDEKPDYDYGTDAEIRIYALKDGIQAKSVVYGMDQNEEISITAEKNGNDIHVTIVSDKNYTIRLVNVSAVGDSAVKDGNDTVLTLSGNADFTLQIQ